MYLKKIVLDGFKSFYTRTEIDLKQGIIGVVGPNGCGKSNIYDAVQWVLGEQSAKELRGQEISDVISTGNVRRGEKNYAEAYLTFDECKDVLDVDRDEIEVGRRVDQDGSGTYYLNGETVRLKDIQDLFRDTGIGQDLYSTIGQGEVFSLIESKPEERREIIEEAAGIASYRHRRDLTKRRLDQTRDELSQVEKDLRQKKGRLSQLKGQAEKAEKVREFRKKLRLHKMEKARRDFKSLQESIDKTRNKIERAKGKWKKAKEEKQKVTEERERILTRKKNIQVKERDLSAYRESIQDRRNENKRQLDRLRTEIESQSERINRETRSIKNDSKRLDNESTNLAEYYEKKYRFQLRKRIADRSISYLRDRQSLKEEERRSIKEELERVRDQSIFKLSEKNEVEQKLKRQRRQTEELDKKISETEEQITKTRVDLPSPTDLDERYDEFVEAEKRRIQMTLRLRRNRTRKTIVEALEERRKTRMDTLRSERDRKRDRRKNIDRQLRSYEGFNPGVQKIMKAHEEGAIEGIKGILAELIQVPDRYRKAVETALNGSLQGIVVEDNAIVDSVVDYVKEKEIGPITLLTCGEKNSSDSMQIPEGDITCPGFQGRVSEMVNCHGDLEGLIERLLGRIGVVNDPLPAIKWLNSDENTRIEALVTPAGLKLNKDGRIQVDVNEENDDLLQRRKEKENLEAELKTLDRELETVKNDLERLGTMSSRLEKRYEQMEGAVGGLREEKRHLEDELRKKVHDYRKSRSELKRLIDKDVELRGKFLKNSIRKRATSRVLSKMQSLNQDQDRKSNRLRARLKDFDQFIRSLRETIRNYEREKERKTARIQEFESQIKQLQKRRKQILSSIRETHEEQREARLQKLRLERDRVTTALENRIEDTQLETWNELHREFERVAQEESDRLDEVNQKLQSLEGKTERRKGEFEKLRSELSNKRERLDEIEDHIREEFDVDPEDDQVDECLGTDLEDRSSDEIDEVIRETENIIREHQPVNMLADQEARELEEEVNETEEQKNDLEEASRELESLINRLNKKAREQFLEAFSEIQDYFEDFIGELFQGGEGHLELTDDEVLESGVTIEIKPPGESLKTMSALSGGEKTLGALAFLFALYEHKSTPFCFLDEVDQSFDDENVNQFVNLLMRYKEQTQFLVITHNKITMQAADKLFGVTMEESGVTSVVPMELEQAQELREPEQATA